MRKLTVFLVCCFLVFTSCRHVSSSVIYSEDRHLGVKCVSEFEFLGTIGISNKPNVLFADMMKAAKSKYGNDVTIKNIRSRQNWKSFLIFSFARQEEVLFDVFKKIEK